MPAIDPKTVSETDTDKLLKIGMLAELCGLSERTLRHYEDLGIIRPLRSSGGTRYYRESDVEIARTAQRLRDLDIPVEMIRVIATRRRDFDTGDQSSAAMIGIIGSLAEDLGDRATKALELQSELIRTLRLLQECRGCKNRPDPQGCPDCPMQHDPDRPAIARLIWQSD